MSVCHVIAHITISAINHRIIIFDAEIRLQSTIECENINSMAENQFDANLKESQR